MRHPLVSQSRSRGKEKRAERGEALHTRERRATSDERRATEDEDTDVRRETRVQGVLGSRGAAHVRHGVEQVRRERRMNEMNDDIDIDIDIDRSGRRRLRAHSQPADGVRSLARSLARSPKATLGWMRVMNAID